MREQGGAWTITLNYLPASYNSFLKTGLSSSTTYEWQIRSACSTDSSSVSLWSSLESFTTLTPCTAPVNLSATGGLTDATLGWDAIPGAWGYRVQYLKSGAAWNTKIKDTVVTNSHYITGLVSNSSYMWRVQTLCDSLGTNKSGFTSFQYFLTLSSNRIMAEDVELGVMLNIYPNPTRGLFNINFISEEVDNFEISIVDAFGQIVLHEDRKEFVGEYTKKVDLSNWPRGIYMVQIKTKDSYVSKRIVLQ